MDDSDFLNSLKTDEEKFQELVDGAEHFIRLKHASILPKSTPKIDIIPLMLTGAGAVTGGISTYLASRPRQELQGQSKREVELGKQIEETKDLPDKGFIDKLRKGNRNLEYAYAKAFREHPGKASILGAGVGALVGRRLSRALGALKGI